MAIGSKFKGRVLRKFLYLFVLSVVITLAVASVAMAQSAYSTSGVTGDCSGAAEEVNAGGPWEYSFIFLPDVGGCIVEGTEVSPHGMLVNDLDKVVFDPDTGERLGTPRELDPDLSSGANSVTHQEFCGAFPEPEWSAQRYFDEFANSKEQAILDPDGDGLACTPEDEAFLAGDTGPTSAGDGQQGQYVAMTPYVDSGVTGDCSGAEERLKAEAPPNAPEEFYDAFYDLTFVPDAGGCVFSGVEGVPVHPLIIALNASVFDPDTGEELGIAKDLDPDLSGGANSVTYQELCGAFPEPEVLTAQEYFEGTSDWGSFSANAKEQAILDPDGDGLACTAEDDAFLAGDAGQPSGQDEPQCINGILDRDGDGRISPIEAAQAGADATQGEDPCSGTDDGQQNDGAGDPGAGDEAERPFEQTWAGTITQTSEDDTTLEYEIEVDIVPISDMIEDLLGEVVGEVRYDSVGCSGVWVLEEINDDSVVVEEQITDGTDVCAEAVPIVLTPQEDGTLECRTGGEYEGVSTGILTLQSGAPDDDASGNDSKNNDDDERLPSEKMADFGITELPDTGGPALLLPVAGLLLGSGVVGAVALSARRPPG